MKPAQQSSTTDSDIRHFIYVTFARTARPPTPLETAVHFSISIGASEDAYERLADAHHIALAPGTSNIWMAHPFSGLATNFVTEVGEKTYWAN